MPSNSLNILVVGAGQIGSRHLQALAAMPSVATVAAVDPSTASRDIALSRWKDVVGHDRKLLRFAQSLAELENTDFDLAIIATSAPGRLEILRQVVALGVRRVLSEKLLFQSVGELDAAVTLIADHGVRLYPNYVYRFVSPWLQVSQHLTDKSFAMDVRAGDIGLATNLPHWLDIFQFVSGAPVIEVNVTLSKPPYPSKRGGGLLEIAGTASARSASGATFEMFCDGPMQAPVATLIGRAGRLIADEGARTLVGDLLGNRVTLEVPMVSRTTALAVSQIMEDQTVLPSLDVIAETNRLLLRALGSVVLDAYDDDKTVPVT